MLMEREKDTDMEMEDMDVLEEAAQEEEEESLILSFAKPYAFEGQEYTEVDLSGLEDVTAAAISAVGKQLIKRGIVAPNPEMTLDFAMYMAARITHKPVEFFARLPAREAIRLKTIVTGFLYGGDGDN